MVEPLNHNQVLKVLWNLTPPMLLTIMWIIFTVFHLALAVVVLCFLWAYQISPQDISVWAQAAYQSVAGKNAGVVIGFLGASGLSLLLAYVKIWRRIYAKLTVGYLMQAL